MFLGRTNQRETTFQCRVNQDTFFDKRLRTLNLRNPAGATLESREHYFLGAQSGKHLLRKRGVSENNQKHSMFLRKQEMFQQQMLRVCINWKYSGKHVSATMPPRLRGT